MSSRTLAGALLGLTVGLTVMAAPALAATGNCAIEALPRGTATEPAWITRTDWLAPENLRYGLANLPQFMPAAKLASTAPASLLKNSPRPLDLRQLTATDPADQKARSVAFLLDSRLYADAVLVIRDDTILFEDYRHGLTPEQPRMLLSATRPVLAMLAAMSTAKGKLRQEKALSRLLPPLASVAELRKISLHTLLNDPAAFQWNEAELGDWRHLSGWDSESPPGGVRAWMKTAPWRLASKEQPGTLHGPEGQLVVWTLEQAWKQALPEVFCQRLFAPLRPEHPAYWATDGEGAPLADGLAMSLRDFGRLGQALLESRGSFRGLLPNWFAEGIASASDAPGQLPPYLAGLDSGSRMRYGFVNVAGKGHRAAAIGAHGNSLFIDFDRRLVIAIFASHPARRSPLMLRTLMNIWEAVESAGGGRARHG